MEPVVLDSSVLVASFLPDDHFHQQALQHIVGLESGNSVFHLPMLVWVEVIASVNRQAQRNRMALLSRAEQSLKDWDSSGKIVLYPLDRDRMNKAASVAERYRLRGADSIVVALAEELDMPLKAFDEEILERFERASP